MNAGYPADPASLIKQVAPVKRAQTDAELGVQEFADTYFSAGEVYHDKDLVFVKALGSRSWLKGLGSWNPITIYKWLTVRTLSKATRNWAPRRVPRVRSAAPITMRTKRCTDCMYHFCCCVHAPKP
jgi:hypothetical protein